MARALLFRAGTVGLICAAYEVEIERATQDRQGTIRPVRDCTNLATELVAGQGTETALCAVCADAVGNSPAVGVAKIQRPGSN
jgi:hypothetical protein